MNYSEENCSLGFPPPSSYFFNEVGHNLPSSATALPQPPKQIILQVQATTTGSYFLHILKLLPLKKFPSAKQ